MVRRKHSSASESSSGGSSQRSPLYQVMTHDPTIPSPLAPFPPTELEIQISKLKDALDTFNLRNEGPILTLSQGGGAVKINFGLTSFPLHTAQAMRTARLCIPFINEYEAFKRMYSQNFSVVSRMTTADVIAMFGANG